MKHCGPIGKSKTLGTLSSHLAKNSFNVSGNVASSALSRQNGVSCLFDNGTYLLTFFSDFISKREKISKKIIYNYCLTLKKWKKLLY